MSAVTAEQRDRLARWVGAYRQLMKGGLAVEAHTAGVEAFARDGEHPYITPDDIEALLSTFGAIGALVARWEREANERGSDDTLNTGGVAAMLRAALGESA